MNARLLTSVLVLALVGGVSAAETQERSTKAESERPAILVPRVELPKKATPQLLAAPKTAPVPTSGYMRKALAEKMAEKKAAQVASAGAGQPTGHVESNPILMAPFVLEEDLEKEIKLPKPPPTIAEIIQTGRIYEHVGKFRTTTVDSLGESTRTGHGRITLGVSIKW